MTRITGRCVWRSMTKLSSLPAPKCSAAFTDFTAWINSRFRAPISGETETGAVAVTCASLFNEPMSIYISPNLLIGTNQQRATAFHPHVRYLGRMLYRFALVMLL